MMAFREFWPLYVRAHSRRSTRGLHYVATAVGLFGTVAAVTTGTFWLCPAAIALAYAIAVLSHWVCEGNQPLITVNPVWGAVSDLRMCWLVLSGRLGRELARHGVGQSGSKLTSMPRPAA